MTTRKRKRPSKAVQRESNIQPFSVREFFAAFPNDDACLTRVMEFRYGLRHVRAPYEGVKFGPVNRADAARFRLGDKLL
jgi:hypothetical protein